ncbi:MAG TPA: hypothetical protein VN700_03480 [Vicinamibacterales bacterium]|nr:hypothetical protein [Vicinamibacterales bacterium]
MNLSRVVVTAHVTLAAFAMASGACAPKMQARVDAVQAGPDTRELWQEPTNIASRDLFNGVGGAALAPQGDRFQFVSRDTTGASPGFDVTDAQGRKWDVKLGVEAQPEVVVSRLLWAVGFHQPPVYYVKSWTLTGGGEFAGPQQGGRFRLDRSDRKVLEEWSWYKNPFVGSRPYAVLIAANVLVNNWDFKSTNNKLYQLTEPVNGVRRQYVVRDLGASLGKSSYPDMFKIVGLDRLGGGTKSDIEGFEGQDFVLEVEGDRVKFDYDGSRNELLKSVKVADVKWACDLFARLSEAQLRDAFRAAAYDPAITARYVRKLQQKIAQGQALAAR